SIEFVLSSLEPKKENSLEPGKIDSRNTNTTPVFMEIGPGNTLTQLVKKCAKNWSDMRSNSDTTSNKGECQRVFLFSGIKAPAVTDADNQHSRIPRAELTSFLTNVAQLWEQGFQVNWQCFPGNPLDHRYSLPTYPWQRKRYWPDSQPGALQTSNPVRSQAQVGQSILLGAMQTIAGSGQHSAFMVYSNSLNPEHHRYLQGHKIHGQCIFPGAAFIEMALTAATKLKYDNFETSNDILICSNAQFKRPILLDSESVALQTHVQSSAPPNASGDQDYTLSIFSHRQTPNPGDSINDNRWLEHAQMSIQRHSAPTVIKKHSGIPSSLDLNRYPQTITGKQFYEQWAYRGNQWTGDFQSIEQLWVNEQDCWGKIRFAPKEKAPDAFLFHPGLLDACAQCLAPLAPEGSGAFVGHSLEKLTLWKRPSDGHFWVHSRLERPIDGTDQTVSGTILKGTLEVYDDQGRLIAQLEGLTIQFIGVEQAANAPLEHLNGHSKPDNESSLATFIETWQDFHLPNNIDQTDPLNEPLKIAIFPIPDDLPLTTLALGELKSETAQNNQIRYIDPDTADQEMDFSQLLVPLDFSAVEESATGLASALSALSLLLTRINQYKSPTETRKIWLVIKSDATTMDRALLAFTRAYSAEHPDIWGGIVLVKEYFDASSLSSIFDLIAYRESESPSVTALNQYLFNSGIFKTPAIEQIIPDLKDNTQGNLPVKGSGVYLITGGLGGLGLIWADWLAKQGAKRIVLLGRTPLPDRRDWPALLESAAPELKKERQAIDTILNLEENGVSITVQSVDVGNYTAFSQWLELWHKTHPAISGVIHAAGVATPCDVEAISEQFLNEQLAAKIDGVRALADFKAEDSFDFLLLFSSVSALLPSPHLSAYAAANAWLSGFAESRENTLSVQWGAFSDRGMLAHINNTGLNSLSAARLTHALWQHSQGNCSRRIMTVVGESASHFQSQLQSAPSFEQVVIATESPTNFGEGLHSQTSDKNATKENIAGNIFNILEPLLNVESNSINETVSLIDLGLDSLLAVELRAKIQKVYNVSIPMVSLLKGITIRELAQEVENSLKIESPPSPALETAITASLDAPYALAYNQQAQWFIHQLQPASSAYHVSFAARFSFDSQAHGLARKLESTLSLIINQHPVLKNGFFVDSDSEEPLQRPQHSDMPIPFTLSEVNDQSEDPHSSQEMLRNTVVECYQIPFDLEKPPLIRAHWIYEKSKSEQGILLLVAHHIVCDGWSLWYLIEELKRHLGGSVDKEAKPEEELTAYPLFVEQQRQYIASKKGTDLAEYWANKGYGNLEPLNLPVIRSNRGAPSPDGKAFHTSLPDLLNKQLRAQAQRCGVTLFSLMLSAYHVLLHKVCRQEQVLVGTPIHGRFDSRFLGTVGNFVNLVPVESRFRAEATVREYVQAQHAVTLDNLDHGEYPLTLIIEQSGALRTDTQNTFIQTSFIMQKPPGDAELIKLFMESEEHAPELLWGDVKLSPYLLPQQMGQFPLAMEIADSETHLNLFLKYDNHLFSAYQISQLAFAYVEILNQFACQPDKPLSEVALHAPKSELDSFTPKNKVAANQEPD
ncbi:MAG: condensation domain-containing protein, partial [Pseudomonadales bacterium]|nr:condensation domain-containing protein [Pseudomonadales bacterium]